MWYENMELGGFQTKANSNTSLIISVDDLTKQNAHTVITQD